MKEYKKLVLPEDTAWERKTWRNYTHWRIKYFIDGVHNIIRWIPTLYHDKDWDDYYITKMLQKKIEYQRDYLVKYNRHTRIDEDNFWMTVTLNLLEREHKEYYGLEYFDYFKSDMIFKDVEDEPGYKSIEFETKWEKLDDYINKYPGTKYRVIRENKGVDFTDKQRLAHYMASHRQQKCRNLLFEILKRKSSHWWD